MSSQILLSRSIRSAPSSFSAFTSQFSTSTDSISILNHGAFFFSSPDLMYLERSTLIPKSNSTDVASEIIHNIYEYLHPKDFNAARHTCRAWMTASLDKRLLRIMLARGGWSDTLPDAEAWQLSCQVARECALSFGWTGNGLEPQSRALSMTTKIDFSELAAGYAAANGKSSGGLIFTVSVCAGFLLVAEGGMIYVYQFLGNDIKPLTSVICPRRVLSMSMDTSSRRFALAALMDGRMGLMCDLQIGKERIITTLTKKHNKAVDGTANNASDVRSSHFLPGTKSLEGIPRGSWKNVTERITDNSARLPVLPLGSSALSSPQGAFDPDEAIPVETGSFHLYRSLCSDDDPPRSVAICPQRHCVAFGCSAGLELHWVDALTGQDLNRWFPLTGPSDHLYFLPTRHAFDSPRKLRLISSIAHPSQRPALSRRFSAPNPKLFSLLSPFGLKDRISSRTSILKRRDHYCAVPMSDGFHILFTDAESNMLCLGSDAPFGDAKRLTRKIMFTPPVQGTIPRIYSAGADLVNGARIVAAYGNMLVLFSVPGDVLEFSRKKQQTKDTTSMNLEQSEEWLEWWSDTHTPFPSRERRIDTELTWPLQINGTVIGQLEGIVDIAVNDIAGFAIWAFCLDGTAAMWQLDNGRSEKTIKLRRIGKNGCVEFDHDVIMMDADPMDWSIVVPDTIL